jgi:hypothetical protein
MRSFNGWRGVMLLVALGSLAACHGNAARGEGRAVATPQAAGTCARVEPDAAGTMRWTGTGSSVEVRSMNGAIRATASEGDAIEILARRHDGQHGAPLRLRVVDRGAVVLACIVQEGRGDDDDGCGLGDGMEAVDERVSIEVHVPRNVRFSGWTANGAVEAEGLDADVEAHAQNGSVRLSTSGAARASTVNGSIHAKLGAKRWDGAIVLDSVNGHVDVELARGVGAELEAETVHGRIRVGLPMTAARVEETRVEGKIGGGGGGLHLRTVNGGIEVN